MSLLEAQGLHLWRGELHVLRGISFAVDAGTCLSLTGANGAGKSSLLRVLAGLLPPQSGSVHWRGADALREREGLHAELAWLGHGNALKSELSAQENLLYSAGLKRPVDAGMIDMALARVGLAGIDARPARQMSAGQQRRIALARTLLLGCPLWLLDEPTSNLDRAGQELFEELLRGHLDGGGLAVVATHHELKLPDTQRARLELS
jgi:heme exporter protein A